VTAQSAPARCGHDASQPHGGITSLAVESCHPRFSAAAYRQLCVLKAACPARTGGRAPAPSTNLGAPRRRPCFSLRAFFGELWIELAYAPSAREMSSLEPLRQKSGRPALQGYVLHPPHFLTNSLVVEIPSRSTAHHLEEERPLSCPSRPASQMSAFGRGCFERAADPDDDSASRPVSPALDDRAARVE